MHYAPTYSSWLKQVERWFGLITQRSIRRGSFRNVTELVQRIARYVTHHNRHAGTFQGTAIADSILGKIARLSKNYLRDVTVGASARPAAKLTSRKESVRKACPKAVPERVALIARKQIAMGCTKDMVRAAPRGRLQNHLSQRREQASATKAAQETTVCS